MALNTVKARAVKAIHEIANLHEQMFRVIRVIRRSLLDSGFDSHKGL
jgi:hypothetical protein